MNVSHREFARLLAPEFTGPSWAAWRSLEDAVFGVAPENADLVRRITGRSVLPTRPVAEAWCVAGRGSGKSRVIGGKVTPYCSCGRTYAHAPGERLFCGIFGPTKPQSAVTFDYLSGTLHSVPALERLIVREVQGSIELATNVVIEVMTGAEASPRNRSYALGVIEEASFFDPDTARELIRALRPGLARVDGSLLLVISSPYDEAGPLHDTWKAKYGSDDPDTLVAVADTLTLNPSFNADAIARAYRDDPVAAASEYGARWRQGRASLFRREALMACVKAGLRERPPVRDGFSKGHLDASTGAGDDAAAAAVARAEDGRGVLMAVRRWAPPYDPELMASEAARFFRAHGVTAVTRDQFAGGLVESLLRRHGLDVEVAERTTAEAYLDLLGCVNARRVDLLDDDVLVNELAGLVRRPGTAGRDRVDHRAGRHDDLAAAAAQALVQVLADDDVPPLMVIGGTAWAAWQAKHGRSEADEEPVPPALSHEDRLALWSYIEPVLLAAEANDEGAAERADDVLESFIASTERRDAATGAAMRALVERVVRAAEGLDV